jgi:hypothetical protein
MSSGILLIIMHQWGQRNCIVIKRQRVETTVESEKKREKRGEEFFTETIREM